MITKYDSNFRINTYTYVNETTVLEDNFINIMVTLLLLWIIRINKKNYSLRVCKLEGYNL